MCSTKSVSARSKEPCITVTEPYITAKSPGVHEDEVLWDNECSCKRALYRKRALHHRKRGLYHHRCAPHLHKSAVYLQKSAVSPLPQYVHWRGAVTWRAALRRRVRLTRQRLFLLLPSGILHQAAGTFILESPHPKMYIHPVYRYLNVCGVCKSMLFSWHHACILCMCKCVIQV